MAVLRKVSTRLPLSPEASNTPYTRGRAKAGGHTPLLTPPSNRGFFGASTGGTLEPHRRDSVSPTPVFASDTHNAVKQRGAFCRVTVFPPPKGKRCTRCREFLPFSAFRPNLRLSSGWSSWCKACCVERTRQWRREHTEHKLLRPRVAPSKLTCVECGTSFEGRKDRLVCSRRCKDRRYARLHPEALREKQRRKYVRRKAA